jgi:PAS domain S-box-containing protein
MVDRVAKEPASELSFRQLIELAPDAVWINDGRRLVYANPAAARMLRYPSVEALLSADPSTFFHDEDRASMRARTEHMFTTKEQLAPREYDTRRADGTWVMTEVHSMPITWEGRPAILGFARDVTQRKEFEARLAQQDRLSALGTLLAGIAHEMNNPLSYALLGIEQTLEALDDALLAPAVTARLRELLDGAREGATRVGGIIGQIRATSRPDVAERGRVELRAVVEAALRVIHNELHHRARLVTDFGDVPAVVGSAQRLEQVVLNLLVNAVQALPDGRAENEIRVATRTGPAGEAMIEVSDSGVGIPDDVRPRVFDPFFTTKAVGEGLGLGLSICHGIVSAHGGVITFTSAPARGTTFRVTLPAAAIDGDAPAKGAPRADTVASAALPRTAPAPAPAPRRARRRVLIVDDELPLAEMMRRTLARDCDVAVAGDARAALALLTSGDAYDVILCDLMMPGMTGMDLFAEAARRHPGLERRFVFMTGGAFTPRAVEFLANVDNRLLEKPFETTALRAAIAPDD